MCRTQATRLKSVTGGLCLGVLSDVSMACSWLALACLDQALGREARPPRSLGWLCWLCTAQGPLAWLVSCAAVQPAAAYQALCLAHYRVPRRMENILLCTKTCVDGIGTLPGLIPEGIYIRHVFELLYSDALTAGALLSLGAPPPSTNQFPETDPEGWSLSSPELLPHAPSLSDPETLGYYPSASVTPGQMLDNEGQLVSQNPPK